MKYLKNVLICVFVFIAYNCFTTLNGNHNPSDKITTKTNSKDENMLSANRISQSEEKDVTNTIPPNEQMHRTNTISMNEDMQMRSTTSEDEKMLRTNTASPNEDKHIENTKSQNEEMHRTNTISMNEDIQMRSTTSEDEKMHRTNTASPNEDKHIENTKSQNEEMHRTNTTFQSEKKNSKNEQSQNEEKANQISPSGEKYMRNAASQKENIERTKTTSLSEDKYKRNHIKQDELFHLPKKVQKVVKLFKTQIPDSDLSIFKMLVQKFIEVMPKNVTYLMMYGSLLGSYRHHGMVPWDCDIDILVRVKDISTFKKVLEPLQPEFYFFVLESYIWRFFHKMSKPMGKSVWKWPFIDIFFYSENETHIWGTDKEHSKPVLEKRLVFPLKARPFMEFSIPAPAFPTEVLKLYYNITDCMWRNCRMFVGDWYVECKYLKEFYPFVKRHNNGSGTIETLYLNNTLVPNHTSFFSKN